MTLHWLKDSDGQWVQGYWSGYQGCEISSFDDDWGLDGFHEGLKQAKLDACGLESFYPMASRAKSGYVRTRSVRRSWMCCIGTSVGVMAFTRGCISSGLRKSEMPG